MASESNGSAAPTPGASDVTLLLHRIKSGDSAAEEQLAPLVLDELHRLARAVFSGQRPGHTLQPTALVNEAWIKLAGNLAPVEGRRHFLVIAARAMRQVIVDHARGRLSAKRGGGRKRMTFDTAIAATEEGAVDLIDLEDSLRRLTVCNARHAQVAELRLFSGLTIEETASVLELSPRTVDKDWAMAKAWLRCDLAGAGGA